MPGVNPRSGVSYLYREVTPPKAPKMTQNGGCSSRLRKIKHDNNNRDLGRVCGGDFLSWRVFSFASVEFGLRYPLSSHKVASSPRISDFT